MTRPIRSSEPASVEFSEAVRWYEARRAGLGGEFFDEVVAILTRIEANPEIGTTIPADARHGARWWDGFLTESSTESSRPRL